MILYALANPADAAGLLFYPLPVVQAAARAISNSTARREQEKAEKVFCDYYVLQYTD